MSQIASTRKPGLAAEYLARFPTTTAAEELLAPSDTTPTYVGKLLDAKLYGDATRLLSHALGPRFAQWWGVLCVWHTLEQRTKEDVQYQALATTVHWVVEPSAANAQAAEQAAEVAGVGTPAGSLALSAARIGALSTGGEVPLRLQRVAANLIGASVMIAAAERESGKLLPQFLAVALEVAEGKNVWTVDS